jgi:N-acetyl-anhydromuramyl-L-alanine amidase AmpD
MYKVDLDTSYLNKTNNKQKRLDIHKLKYLIIHHTAWSFPWDFNMLNWINKNSTVSVHYYIRKTWQIYQFVSDDYIAYHTGQSDKWPVETVPWWGWNLNPISLWIEIENRWDGKDIYTLEQEISLFKLSNYIIEKYDLNTQNVLGHKEITSRKIDPSSNFFMYDMLWFRRFLREVKLEKVWYTIP